MMKMVMKVNLRLQNAEWNSALEKVSVTGATITLSWVWLKNWANKLHFMYSLCWGNQRAEAECQVQKTDGFSIQFRRENCWCHYKWQGLNSSGRCYMLICLPCQHLSLLQNKFNQSLTILGTCQDWGLSIGCTALSYILQLHQKKNFRYLF